MPRKANTSNMKISAIANYFRTAPLEVAEAALELSQDAIKERRAKGKAVLAGRASGAASAKDTSAAVDAATKSAIAPKAKAAKRKPGPAKGSKRKKAAPQTDAAPAAEVTSALPPQEGVLDLDNQ